MFMHTSLGPCACSFAVKHLSLVITFQLKLVRLLNHLFGNVFITLLPNFN